MTPIEQIRAALEAAIKYPNSTHAELKATDALAALAEVETFAEIGRQWNTDSSLAKWFPLTADRLWQDAQEIAKLRTDLAAAVARAEQAEARLAAIDGAPTVAMLCPLTESAFNESTLMTAYQKAKMPHVELIARPAKD